MTDHEEKVWLDGEQAAYRSMLAHCLRRLSTADTTGQTAEVRAAQLELQRSETIAAPRTACEEFGDTEWDDDLSVVDILEKHLIRHIRPMSDGD